MKISDLIENVDQAAENSVGGSIDLEEVEKTAELLEALSQEDSLIDDLAKLAVFQDLSETASMLNKSGAYSYRQAEKLFRTASKSEKAGKVAYEAVKKQKAADQWVSKIDALKNGVEIVDSGAGSFLPGVILGGVGGAAATGAIMKKRNDVEKQKMLNEVAAYYEAQQNKNK